MNNQSVSQEVYDELVKGLAPFKGKKIDDNTIYLMNVATDSIVSRLIHMGVRDVPRFKVKQNEDDPSKVDVIPYNTVTINTSIEE